LIGDVIYKSDICDTELDCLSGLLTNKPDEVRRAVLLKGTPKEPNVILLNSLAEISRESVENLLLLGHDTY
jgi:hypothetical protein